MCYRGRGRLVGRYMCGWVCIINVLVTKGFVLFISSRVCVWGGVKCNVNLVLCIGKANIGLPS